jgi:hypothetical protein
MIAFSSVRAVARDAQCRLLKVTLFFDALFVVAVVGAFILDRIPPRPHLECTVHEAQTMSPYPHPYGEPPAVQWTRCEWKPHDP